MSQKLTRKSQNPSVVIVINDDIEKTDSPIKEMKKKVAANAEKEKQTTEKSDKPVEKNDKAEPGDKHKPAEKTQKEIEKPEKQPEKAADKKVDKADKNGEKKPDKTDKGVEKKADKSEKAVEKKTDKSDKAVEKKPDKAEKGAEKKVDKPVAEVDKKEDGKGDQSKEKPVKPVNGTHNGAAAGGAHGTVSDESGDELVIEEDELFPELTYDDSDTDTFDSDWQGRSLTRRSQVKVTKTPETPRPTSEKESEDSKESKLLKLKDDGHASDRKLRSAGSPKPESKKDAKAPDSPNKQKGQEEEKKSSSSKKDLEASAGEEGAKDGDAEGTARDLDVEVVVEVESVESVSAPRTRARVSPYNKATRPDTHARLEAPHARESTHVRNESTHSRQETTTYSTMADYSGNNSTMEMDISETSSVVEDPSLNDSAYLRGLRGIRGRSSYKLLGELRPAPAQARLARLARVNVAEAVEASISHSTSTSRPTGAVVGRKRRPSDPPAVVERASEAAEDTFAAHSKRTKLLDRLDGLRDRLSVWGARADAEIVGINSDLPLTAPVASTSTFDPESIKPLCPLSGPVATPLPPSDRDGKRCIIM